MSLLDDGLKLLGLVDKGLHAALYRELGEWVNKVAHLQKESEDQKCEIAQLRERLRFKGTVERIKGHTFVEGCDEEICPKCVQEMRAVPLEPMFSDKPPYQKATCPVCATPYLQSKPVRRSSLGS